jgi:hypothetical protein
VNQRIHPFSGSFSPSARFQTEPAKYEKAVLFVEKQFYPGLPACCLSTDTATVDREIIIQSSKLWFIAICRDYVQK